ncbi:hypothetical protein PIROE2DRAFT_45896, partial [Piromyces sp. E2]
MDSHGYCNPLLYACEKGNENIVKILIENGADLNKANKYGYTPLIIVCEKGEENIAKLLIEKGADLN